LQIASDIKELADKVSVRDAYITQQDKKIMDLQANILELNHQNKQLNEQLLDKI
jgi:cell division protein FtsB